MGHIVNTGQGPRYQRTRLEKTIHALQLPVAEDSPLVAACAALLFVGLANLIAGAMYLTGCYLPLGGANTLARALFMLQVLAVGGISLLVGLLFAWIQEI